MTNPRAHRHTATERALWVAFLLNFAFLGIEVGVGVLTNSLALLSDAGHMVSDVAALAIALVAERLGRVGSTGGFTFGLRRVPVLGAFGNALALLAIAGVIVWEAWQRLQHPPQVVALPVLITGLLGLLVNASSAGWLHRIKSRSLNIQGAVLHLVADALGSAGVVVAALVLMTIGWAPIDAVVSMVIASLILFAAWPLLRDSARVLLQTAPAGIDLEELRQLLQGSPAVQRIFDLHIWEIDTGQVVLTAVLVTANCALIELEQVASQLRERLRQAFGIEHATFEWRTSDGECRACEFS